MKADTTNLCLLTHWLIDSSFRIMFLYPIWNLLLLLYPCIHCSAWTEFEVLLTPTEWVKVHALQKLQLSIDPHTSWNVLNYNLILAIEFLQVCTLCHLKSTPIAWVWTPTRCAVVCEPRSYGATELQSLSPGSGIF